MSSYPSVICRKRKICSGGDVTGAASPFLKLKKVHSPGIDAPHHRMFYHGGTTTTCGLDPDTLQKFSERCRQQCSQGPVCSGNDRSCMINQEQDTELNGAFSHHTNGSEHGLPVDDKLYPETEPATDDCKSSVSTDNTDMEVEFAYDYYLSEEIFHDRCPLPLDIISLNNIPIVGEEDFDDLDVVQLCHDSPKPPRHGTYHGWANTELHLADESDDSNAEDNWRNDYPDEDPDRLDGFGDPDSLLEGMLGLNVCEPGRDEFASDRSDVTDDDYKYALYD